MLNKQQIKDDADMLIVAESLGINLVRKGTNYQCLCPFHADRNIGSCYINSRRLHCYSCGAQADVFKLVQQVNDCDFKAAVKYVADLCGGEEIYTMTDTEELDIAGFIPRPVQERIGIENTPVLVIEEATGDAEYAAAKRNEGKEIDINPQSGFYLIMSVADANPLYTLFKDNPEAYRDLVDQKCQSKISSLEAILQYERYSPKTESDNEWIAACRKLQTISGTKLLSKAIQSMTAEIEGISLKYGNGKAVASTQFYVSAVADSIWDQEGAF